MASEPSAAPDWNWRGRSSSAGQARYSDLHPGGAETELHQRPQPQAPGRGKLGAGTDPDFYEGILIGLKELGLRNFHFIEANLRNRWNYGDSWTSTSATGWP